MQLDELYFKTAEAISKLDFSRIWPGFKPLKFALYDNEKCFFDGAYIEKSGEFCANTSIEFRGEQIAIWNVMEELDIPVMTSKMVHEMFHGFQHINGWNCGPNEMEALYSYSYDPENLSIKLRENELLLCLLDRFDDDSYRELIKLRKLRSMEHPYEFSYESSVEEIEGTANFVEWQVLKQLDEAQAEKLKERMHAVMTKPEYLFPIRISCYYTGALLINAMLCAGEYGFCAEKRPVSTQILEGVVPAAGFAVRADVSDAVETFNSDTRAIIESALKKNEIALKGPCELVYVNIYNARCLNGFITSTYFVAYKNGDETAMLQGDFVVKMLDERTIDIVYRWA